LQQTAAGRRKIAEAEQEQLVMTVCYWPTDKTI